MGVRFSCHVCSKKLNIKEELAGRRGICPACSARIRIPVEDADFSTAVDDPKPALAATAGDTSGSSNGSSVPEPTNGAAVKQRANKPESKQAPSISGRIDALDGEPTSTWYVRPPSGGQYGPADGDTLRDWIKEGRVASNSLLWRDGWPQWREAKNALLEIADQLPSAESAPDTPISTPNNQTVEKTSISEDEINDFGFQELEASSPQQPAQKSPALNEADHKIGAQRRAKNSKRIVTIGMLIGTAVLLLAGVVYLAQR